ncbi:protein ABHD16A isoform X2 [Trichoplusia ni]|uniref:Protein ABHD16A isoform X2 n=1 Tax=Trichoplusia ni TaxID=7111 RepID=A0A7E5W622_TRINI|nr:protein ABHD16A isoform X2 [Trichoplusia ni]
MMKLIWQCLFSPRLYKVYKDGPKDSMYQPQGLEKWGDRIISKANTILNIGLYTSPFICMYIYKRGFFTYDEMRTLGRFFGGITCLIIFSFILRSYGRATSTKYAQFIRALYAPMTDKKAYLTEIRKYDFEFNAWPTTYSVAAAESYTNDPIIRMESIVGRSSWLDKHPFKTCANLHLPLYQRATIQILAFVATHTFGLRLIYPGSLGVLQVLLWGALFQGRTQLVENHNGQRSKLGTADGNTIDTMFVDHRGQSPNGKKLVVCCEGNSGFYEMGIMNTPIKAGFSALGWNHPGFGGSSGLPYPSQEHNAIDVVMQFAINELGFRPDDIIMFGWSIGGYTASWAAVNYPVGALVLDATFDDLLPLAENQMPSSWSLLVKEVIRSYVDLNVAELVTKYDGPVHLIRRTEDEIICLRQGHLSSNRGNNLVVRILEQRHPAALGSQTARAALSRLLAAPDSPAHVPAGPDVQQLEKTLQPLVSKYMRDLRSSHCSPLPENDFVEIIDRLQNRRRE